MRTYHGLHIEPEEVGRPLPLPQTAKPQKPYIPRRLAEYHCLACGHAGVFERGEARPLCIICDKPVRQKDILALEGVFDE